MFLVLITQGYVPLFVNATAGSTVYGAFDPINEIADICEKYNLWLHVDVSSLTWTALCLNLSIYIVFDGAVCLCRVPGAVDCLCPGSIAIS